VSSSARIARTIGVEEAAIRSLLISMISRVARR
jgi:hypothetical protein